jgi:hypothetical protein
VTAWHREVAVYYYDIDREEQAEVHKAASAAYDDAGSGWLVVTLDNDRGVFKYPLGRVIKVRESGGTP